MGIVAEEADESIFWLEMLSDSGIVRAERVDSLLKESKELTAIFTAALYTTKASR
jgi:four helix bundle protein